MDSFYYSEDWLYLAKTIKTLYGWKCMKCGTKNAEMHADHIIPRSKNKSLSLDIRNLQVLCKKCNLEKLNLEEIDYRTEEQKTKLEKIIPTLREFDYVMKDRLQSWIDRNFLLINIDEADELMAILTHFGFNLQEP